MSIFGEMYEKIDREKTRFDRVINVEDLKTSKSGISNFIQKFEKSHELREAKYADFAESRNEEKYWEEEQPKYSGFGENTLKDFNIYKNTPQDIFQEILSHEENGTMNEYIKNKTGFESANGTEELSLSQIQDLVFQKSMDNAKYRVGNHLNIAMRDAIKKQKTIEQIQAIRNIHKIQENNPELKLRNKNVVRNLVRKDVEKLEEDYRISQLQQGSFGGGFFGDMMSSMTDMTTLASMFVPYGGQARAASLLSKALSAGYKSAAVDIPLETLREFMVVAPYQREYLGKNYTNMDIAGNVTSVAFGSFALSGIGNLAVNGGKQLLDSAKINSLLKEAEKLKKQKGEDWSVEEQDALNMLTSFSQKMELHRTDNAQNTASNLESITKATHDFASGNKVEVENIITPVMKENTLKILDDLDAGVDLKIFKSMEPSQLSFLKANTGLLRDALDAGNYRQALSDMQKIYRFSQGDNVEFYGDFKPTSQTATELRFTSNAEINFNGSKITNKVATDLLNKKKIQLDEIESVKDAASIFVDEAKDKLDIKQIKTDIGSLNNKLEKLKRTSLKAELKRLQETNKKAKMGEAKKSINSQIKEVQDLIKAKEKSLKGSTKVKKSTNKNIDKVAKLKKDIKDLEAKLVSSRNNKVEKVIKRNKLSDNITDIINLPKFKKAKMTEAELKAKNDLDSGMKKGDAVLREIDEYSKEVIEEGNAAMAQIDEYLKNHTNLSDTEKSVMMDIKAQMNDIDKDIISFNDVIQCSIGK